MRYKELKQAREQLKRVAKYLQTSRPIPPSFTLSGSERDAYIAALEVLVVAINGVREELKHPERFNLDGTRRVVKMHIPLNLDEYQ